MHWACTGSVFLLVAFAQELTGAQANKVNADCGACMMLVSELEHGISLIDPRKKIEVGSFRVDPKGNQRGLSEISFSRSEAHIYELLDNVCEKYKDYATAVNPATGKQVYVRTKDYDNKQYRLPGSDSSSKVQSRLNSACHSVLDDHEETLVKFLSNAATDPVREFCHVQAELCSSVDVTRFPLEYLPDEPPAPKPEDASLNNEGDSADTNDDDDDKDEL